MFSNFKKWVFVLFVLIWMNISLVKAELIGDSRVRFPWPRKRGSHAIYAVGDRSEILISASNYRTLNGTDSEKIGVSSTGRCNKVVNKESGTFTTPCKLTTRNHHQVYHAECVKGSGSASLTFFKLDGPVKEYSVQVITAGFIWAGFTNKKGEPLKQGILNNKGDRVAVVLNCKNAKRGRY